MSECPAQYEGLRDSSRIKEHIRELVELVMRTDVKAGEPDPTFAAFSFALNGDEEKSPIENMQAGLEYIKARYGRT